jgi:hypothetical protein
MSVKELKCPKCGAPIARSSTGICEYCNTRYFLPSVATKEEDISVDNKVLCEYISWFTNYIEEEKKQIPDPHRRFYEEIDWGRLAFRIKDAIMLICDRKIGLRELHRYMINYPAYVEQCSENGEEVDFSEFIDMGRLGYFEM